MDNNTKKELQSAAFERLIKHLRERKDVQNIDLMNLSGFAEFVYLNGIEKNLKKKELKSLTQMLGNMFMECLTLSGKKNITSNFLTSDKISSNYICFTLVFSFYNNKTNSRLQ